MVSFFRKKKTKNLPETDENTFAEADNDLPNKDLQDEELPEKEFPLEEEIHSDADISSEGLFSRLRKGLAKTRDFLTADVDDLLLGRKLDEELLEDLEEKLITADLGVETALGIVEHIRSVRGRIQSSEDLKEVLREEMLKEIRFSDNKTEEDGLHPLPRVILVVGVNGVGKTTSIGKLASLYTQRGKKVMLAAGDTFRAAAGEQLALWAERSGAGIIRHKDNSDPAAVAYDALDAALARKSDILIVDTAGRLHNKANLMEELKKIRRTLEKRMPGAPHETFLVLDATTGQNGLRQAEFFHEAIGLTGLILTKLDGTAKGGIVIAIHKHFGLPIRYIGVGEKIEDLQPFDAETFLKAMF